MSKYRKINNNKGIAIQEPFAPTIKLALSADNADSASNTLSVLLKLVSNDNNILIPAISMEKSPYMIEVLTICVTISIFPSQTIDKFNATVTNATQFVDNEDSNKKQPSGTASERWKKNLRGNKNILTIKAKNPTMPNNASQPKKILCAFL
jgi:hypothetical protein